MSSLSLVPVGASVVSQAVNAVKNLGKTTSYWRYTFQSTFKTTLGPLVLLWMLLAATPIAAQQNVLVIIADDLGVDYMASYEEGSEYAPTPTLDKLAEEGLLFTNAWAYPGCSPTRASILTGRFGFRNGVGTVVTMESQAGISTEEYTLPKALADANSGYDHSLIGKWHLADENNGGDLNPNIMGFDHYTGDLFTDKIDFFEWEKTTNGEVATVSNYMPTENVDDAIAWLETHEGPWFQWLAFVNPHTPHHLPPLDLHRYDYLPGSRWHIRNNPIPYFKASVEAMDSEINRLFEYLKTTGEYDNTTIIFIGDNGTDGSVVQPPFDADRAKSFLYEGGINIPFIVAGPSVAVANEKSDALVQVVDIFATVLDLIGVDINQVNPAGNTLDSLSLTPILANPEADVRDWVFTEMFGYNDTQDGKAIRNQDYKVLRFDSGITEFYNLQNDPFEQENLLDGPLTTEEQNHFDWLNSQLEQLLSS